MVEYSGGTIKMMRGDFTHVNLKVYNSDGSERTIKDTDEIRFFLLREPVRRYNSYNLALNKVFSKPEVGKTARTVSMDIKEADTLYLNSELYYYSIVFYHDAGTAAEYNETISYGRFILVY